MSKEKTATEWLADNLMPMIHEAKNIGKILEICEQANAMHEQQIIDAANWDSKSISENGIRKGVKYYKDTYNTNHE